MKSHFFPGLLCAVISTAGLASESVGSASAPVEPSRVETLTLSDGNRLQVVYVGDQLVAIIHDKEGFFARKDDEPAVERKAPALKTRPGHHPARIKAFDLAEYIGSEKTSNIDKTMWQVLDDTNNIMGYIICGDKGCGFNGYPPEGS
ncbi:hypothetical protein [Thiolapillus brandeum]|uniref:Uncharacterized protein n=1 Tax=Thiolapillus brandeum TaxID=1076588 RepID=A0A7U6GG36_9GAMM|nr:hypothetical protein [Thiolapillus brandeum]BAO42992.1 hypothetical protein TBH_C0042 [Thiolapillus brandeum]